MNRLSRLRKEVQTEAHIRQPQPTKEPCSLMLCVPTTVSPLPAQSQFPQKPALLNCRCHTPLPRSITTQTCKKHHSECFSTPLSKGTARTRPFSTKLGSSSKEDVFPKLTVCSCAAFYPTAIFKSKLLFPPDSSEVLWIFFSRSTTPTRCREKFTISSQ